MIRVLNDNPVVWAERSFQQTMTLPRSTRRFTVLISSVLIMALVSSLALALEPQLAAAGAIPPDDLHEALRSWFGVLAIILFVLLMVQHLSLATFGLQVAAVAIPREKQGRTWESLLLTGIDARWIVVGKWWAAVQRVLIGYRPLLVLRFLGVLWLALASEMTDFYAWYEPPSSMIIIVYAALIAIFPPIYAAFSAALGLLAGLIMSSQTAAVRIGGLLHLGTIMLSLALLFVLVAVTYRLNSSWTVVIPAVFLTPIDSGMLTLLSLLTGGSNSALSYWIGIALCILLYAGLTLLTLRIAQALAVRQRALPPN